VQQDQLEDGRSNILVLGLRRVRLVEEFRGPPYRMGRVEEVRDSSPSAPLAHARLIATLQRLSAELRHDLDVSELALVKAAEAAAEGATAQLDYLAGSFVRDADLRQQLLEETDPSVRLLRWTAALQERASATQLDTERQRDWN
jgi:Lon protease-like protein